MKSFQFKIQLIGIVAPPVWRRILVSDKITFDEFHNIIQIAFGWENCHLYLFAEKGWDSEKLYQIPDDDDYYNNSDDHLIIDSMKTAINKVFNIPLQTFTYIYDFGDGWKHSVILEKITDGITFPLCIEGQGSCPPEDCGGEVGYKNLIKVLNDPTHQDNIEMKEWLGLGINDSWDVNVFDIDQTNKDLKEYYGH